MKLTNKIVQDVVTEVAGDDVVPLVNNLKNKKNVSEFKLAENIKKEVNEVRNMLYRLYDANLVSFIRRKDKKKGWYIYYWTFNLKRIKYLVSDLKRKRLTKLKERLDREIGNHFFLCNKSCIRLDFEQSTSFSFKCPECGELLNQEDNARIIKDIQDEIKFLEKELRK